MELVGNNLGAHRHRAVKARELVAPIVRELLVGGERVQHVLSVLTVLLLVNTQHGSVHDLASVHDLTRPLIDDSGARQHFRVLQLLQLVLVVAVRSRRHRGDMLLRSPLRVERRQRRTINAFHIQHQRLITTRGRELHVTVSEARVSGRQAVSSQRVVRRFQVRPVTTIPPVRILRHIPARTIVILFHVLFRRILVHKVNTRQTLPQRHYVNRTPIRTLRNTCQQFTVQHVKMCFMYSSHNTNHFNQETRHQPVATKRGRWR